MVIYIIKEILMTGSFLMQFQNPDPISFSKFVDLLKKKAKYTINESQGTSFTRDNKAVPSRHLRMKYFEIVYISDLGQMTVFSENLHELIKFYPKMLRFIDECRMEKKSNPISFYEIYPKCILQSDRKPINHLKDIIDKEVREDFGKIVGQTLNTFALRFSIPIDSNMTKSIRKMVPWFEMTIMPWIENPQQYAFELVYRTDDLKKFNSMMSRLIDVIKGSIH
jgi:hypothetical protein